MATAQDCQPSRPSMVPLPQLHPVDGYCMLFLCSKGSCRTYSWWAWRHSSSLWAPPCSCTFEMGRATWSDGRWLQCAHPPCRACWGSYGLPRCPKQRETITAALLGHFLLGEAFGRLHLLALLLAVGGAVLIWDPETISTSDPRVSGNALALGRTQINHGASLEARQQPKVCCVKLAEPQANARHHPCFQIQLCSARSRALLPHTLVGVAPKRCVQAGMGPHRILSGDQGPAPSRAFRSTSAYTLLSRPAHKCQEQRDGAECDRGSRAQHQGGGLAIFFAHRWFRRLKINQRAGVVPLEAALCFFCLWCS